MAPVFLLLSALGGFISVALGAFAAHGLRERLEPPLLAVFQTGVRYQVYHALALLGVALWPRLAGAGVWRPAAGWRVRLGLRLFCRGLSAPVPRRPRRVGRGPHRGGPCL